MNIAIIYTVSDYVQVDKPLPTGATIPFGIAIISSVLQRAGHEVSLLILTPDQPLLETVNRFFNRCQPRLVCLTAVTTQFPFVNHVAKTFKQIAPSVFVVLGGHHATLMPEDAIDSPFIDAICVGEGDVAVIELASQIESGRQPTIIHNLWIKHPGSKAIEKNPYLPFNSDIDTLPFVDRNLWRTWIAEPDKNPSVLVGRGCPFNCSYCSNHALRKLTEGRYVRLRSPENVVAEIDQIAKRPSVKTIYLEVETIGANINYALKLSKELAEFNDKQSDPIKFKINLAVTSKLTNNISLMNQLFTAFSRANIVTINLGIESGSERIRNLVLRRPRYSNDDIILFCECAKNFGIKINIYVIIGIPGETPDDFKHTIEVVRKCAPNAVMLSIFYPYPGTDLYKVVKNKGLLKEYEGENVRERKSVCINLPEYPRRKIIFDYITFKYNIYKGKWPFLLRVISIFQAFILMNRLSERCYLYLARKTEIGRFLLQKYQPQF